MSDAYTILLLDPRGATLIGEFSGSAIQLEIVRSENQIGSCQLVLPPTVDYTSIKKDSRIAVMRSINGAPAQLEGETVFLVRRRARVLDSGGSRAIGLQAFDAVHLLKRRIVAFADASPQANKIGAADTLMREVVEQNLGASSGTDRDLSAYMSIGPATGAGATVAKSFPRRKVIDVLRELAEASAAAGVWCGFDVVAPGTKALEFRTYVGWRGLDRRWRKGSGVLLGADSGTLQAAESFEDWTEEETYVYAGGQGQQGNRAIGTAGNTSAINDSPFGRSELWQDARQGSDATLGYEAAMALWQARPRRGFTGSFQPTDSVMWGRDIGFGDLVTASHEGEQYDCRIKGYRLSVSKDSTAIDVQLGSET